MNPNKSKREIAIKWTEEERKRERGRESMETGSSRGKPKILAA